MNRNWRTPFALLISALLISGCAHTASKPNGKDWRTANIHKVIVVCVQGDQNADRRIESNMVPKFRHQGFDAVAAEDFFPAAAGYSPKEMMDLIQRSQVDGIIEIAYSGEVPADGLPRQVKFKYHSIRSQTKKLYDRRLPLNRALSAVIGS